MSNVVTAEQRGGVALLTLNRPDQMNALSAELVAALGQELARCSADTQVRVVVITGAGRAFCAGADLIEAAEVTRDSAAFRQLLLSWKSAFSAMDASPKPVIAALNGLTLAGGLELALAADYMVASSAAKIGDVHANFGLVPGGGGSQRLTDAVGSRAARWLMFTGETLDAEQARSIGLVQDVFSADTFLDDVWAFGTKMASRSATGMAFMKRMSRPRAITDDGLDLEIDAAAHLVVGPDAREGLAAFAEKRPPHFTAAAQ
ncbi:enoyl-CoA hydratase/isomerase family protein [Gordonia polyisoprenivorans]|uniref:enoyl-CoA hydratase/isomerase family protein n=1 Tax=Gordonia polyisoprenivorans TaxID=84595 RepID=UPI001AD7A539|nr:enoyl-CoA hydratase/isomerase family protein [Gordonia polyisoprenivorans]QTI69942.1 enoyl-CoA hydratase/isomerase family protein [Gordonia polyisoprenivorans]